MPVSASKTKSALTGSEMIVVGEQHGYRMSMAPDFKEYLWIKF